MKGRPSSTFDRAWHGVFDALQFIALLVIVILLAAFVGSNQGAVAGWLVFFGGLVVLLLVRISDQLGRRKRGKVAVAPGQTPLPVSAADGNPPAPTTEPVQERCGNCGRQIGRLETPHLWKEQVVCAGCRRVLEQA